MKRFFLYFTIASLVLSIRPFLHEGKQRERVIKRYRERERQQWHIWLSQETFLAIGLCGETIQKRVLTNHLFPILKLIACNEGM